MKKIAFGIFGLVLLVSCKNQQTQIDKVVENGVEVILNHIQPYHGTGGPVTFKLEEELVINAEREDLKRAGLRGIWQFDIDSQGNIYVISVCS